MIEPRLASEMQISAFRRLAEESGGFATILRKGDPVSGAILLIARIRGGEAAIYERFPTLDGGSQWQRIPQKTEDSEGEISRYLDRRVERDTDLWLIELDVADDKRLAAIVTKQA